jgi:K+-sensing histidine kinase KdpD
MYADIQATMNELASNLETHMRDRHKFLLDIVADLKAPLQLLQSGKYILEDTSPSQKSEQQQLQAAEEVRRGLAIFSGSLEDLSDIVDINRLDARLEERTVDLSELLSDVSRTLMGFEFGKRVSVSVPPIPVWVNLDVRRVERVLVHVISKIMGATAEEKNNLSISVSESTQGGFRGVEIVIQDSDRTRNGRPIIGGPEQDILNHWISENGISMTLAHKIIRAHGGMMTASGVAGMSVRVTIRFPQERVVSRGLISPPTQAVGQNVGLTQSQGLSLSIPSPATQIKTQSMVLT